MRALILAVSLLWVAPAAADVHGIPLPRGSRKIAANHFNSGRNFRKTVQYYQRLMRRRASPHDAIPVYRYRGVAVARFVSRAKRGKWSAIHVFRASGRTQIYVVPGPGAAPKDRLDEPRKPR